MRYQLFLLVARVLVPGAMVAMEPSSSHKRRATRTLIEVVPVQVSCRYCESTGVSRMFSTNEEEAQHIWDDHRIIVGERVFQEYHLPRRIPGRWYQEEYDDDDDDRDLDGDDRNNDQHEEQPRKGKRSYDEMSSSSSVDE